MPIRVVQAASEQSDAPRAGIYHLPVPDPSEPQLPSGVSLCMIMKNEERFLAQCLESVRGVVDEICIVDTGSTDRSVEIAESFGARVEHHPWRSDFSWARNLANKMARFRWILSLDADEELTPASGPVVKTIGMVPAAMTAVSMQFKNVTDSLAEQSVYSHFLPRLFPNSPRIGYMGAVHERLVYDGKESVPMVDAPLTILHHGYMTEVIESRGKLERNMPLIRAEAEKNPDDPFCLFNLGTVLATGGEIDEGIAVLTRMFEIAKRKGVSLRTAFFPPAYCTLASAYIVRNKDYDLALATIRECLEHAPLYANANFTEAGILQAMGDKDGSREALLRTLACQDYNRNYSFVDEEITTWRAKFYVALNYADRAEFDDCVTWLERAIAGRSDVPLLHVNRARALELADRMGEAERAYADLRRDFPTDDSFAEYLRFLLRRRRYERAMEVINQHIATLGEEAKIDALFAAAGIAYRTNIGDPHDYLNRALELDPEPQAGDRIRALDELYLELGDVEKRAALRARELENPPVCRVESDWIRRTHRLLEEHRFAEAAEAAAGALKEFPKSPQLHYNAAAAMLQIDRIEDAIEQLDELEPFPERDIYLQGRFLRTVLLERMQRLDEAEREAEGLHKLDASNADIVLRYASILESAKKTDQAVCVLRDAIDEPSRRIAVALTTLLMQHGRFDEARNAADAALIGSVAS